MYVLLAYLLLLIHCHYLCQHHYFNGYCRDLLTCKMFCVDVCVCVFKNFLVMFSHQILFSLCHTLHLQCSSYTQEIYFFLLLSGEAILQTQGH